MSNGILIGSASAARITGMLVDGIFASEAIDSSGEVFDVAGADISDLEEGRGLANWEHRGDDVEGASGLDIVGKIVFARKVMTRSDCENERQASFWEKVRLPFVYGIVRLYDGAGHIGAQALAAQIRDHVANDEAILVRFSIEGSTLEKEGNRLVRTVARRVALTIKPCNRTCDSGIVADPNAPAGFDKEPEGKQKDIIADIFETTKKYEHPMYTKLGGSTTVETKQPFIDVELVKSMVKAKVKAKLLEKALTAGGGTGAPSTLTGGAALQREDLKRSLVNVAKAAVRDYRPEDGDFKKFLKSRMPEASDEFVEHFAGLVDDFKAKLKKAVTEDVADLPGDAKEPETGGDTSFEFGYNAASSARSRAQARALEPKTKSPRKEPVEPPEPVRPGVYTRLGKPVSPVPGVTTNKHVTLDEHEGVLRVPEGEFPLYNPDADESLGRGPSGKTVAGERFSAVLHSEGVARAWEPAMRSWLPIHHAMRDGRLPKAIPAAAAAFSLLSGSTPVPMQELMYAHVHDMSQQLGFDSRDPRFGDPEVMANFLARDRPHGFPMTSMDYFIDKIFPMVTRTNEPSKKDVLEARSRGEEMRSVGDLNPFMYGEQHFGQIQKYHEAHNALVNVIARHGVDGRSAIEELMSRKHENNLWQGKRRVAESSDKQAPPERGLRLLGLANKTTRFTYAMSGAGNIVVPDTHFIRNILGLSIPHGDGPTIEKLKTERIWHVPNAPLLSALDRWYFNNHPAVQFVLNHPEFGHHFRSNPEQAIFPAFWAHWLSIAPFEELMGRGDTSGSNEAAEHRPFFEAVEQHLANPKETGAGQTIPRPGIFSRFVRKSESLMDGLLHPFHAAGMVHKIEQRYGEGLALFTYISQLAPMIAPSAVVGPKTSPEAIIRKMEALTLTLRKAAAALPAESPATKPEPASGRRKPYRFEPDAPSPLLDANVHGIGALNNSDEQHALIHGMDVSKTAATPAHMFGSAATQPTWMKTASGKHAIVKMSSALEAHDGVNLVRREVAYHNMARDVFGMGHYVPTTAVFRHPTNGGEYSVQEMVPSASHAGPFDLKNVSQAAALMHLHANGETDKLRVMNTVLGNIDRHYGNFCFTDDPSGPPIRMIDHSHVFRYDKDSTGVPCYARYTRDQLMMQPSTDGTEPPAYHAEPIHPAANAWLQGLDENRLRDQFEHHQFPTEYANEAVKRLRALKLRAGQNASRYKTFDSFDSPLQRAFPNLDAQERKILGIPDEPLVSSAPGTRPLAEPGTTK